MPYTPSRPEPNSPSTMGTPIITENFPVPAEPQNVEDFFSEVTGSHARQNGSTLPIQRTGLRSWPWTATMLRPSSCNPSLKGSHPQEWGKIFSNKPINCLLNLFPITSKPAYPTTLLHAKTFPFCPCGKIAASECFFLFVISLNYIEDHGR